MTDIISPIAIRVAATLRLADLIASGADRLPELAAAAGVEPSALGRLLRFLVCRGVFAEPEPQVFALTGPARMLLASHPARLREWFDLESPGGRIDVVIATGLLESVRTGRSSYENFFGRPFWSDLAEDPKMSASFEGVMAAGADRLAPELLETYDWPTTGNVVDVGGGSGAFLATLLTARPGLHGTLVEVPSAAAAAAHRFAVAGLADRAASVNGSMFDPLPPGGDIYVLSRVLHDWPDDDGVTILRRCAEAARPAGKVLVVERIVTDADDPSMPAVTEHDLRMLVALGGRERSFDEYAEMADAAGLKLRLVGRVSSFYSLLEGAPALDTSGVTPDRRVVTR